MRYFKLVKLRLLGNREDMLSLSLSLLREERIGIRSNCAEIITSCLAISLLSLAVFVVVL